LGSDRGTVLQRQVPPLSQFAHDVHLRDYIAAVLKHVKVVAVIAIAALILGLVSVWSAKVEYQASTVLRIGQRRAAEDIAGSLSGSVSWEKELITYCHIITGPELAKTVVQKLNINSREDLGLKEPDPGLLGKLRNWVVKLIPTPPEALLPPQGTRATLWISSLCSAAGPARAF